MSIKVVEEDIFYKILGAPTSIYLSGTIEKNSPKKIKEVLNKHKNEYIHIYIDSPGGNLIAGMEIGKILRDNSVSITVGKKGLERKADAGLCMSSCSLAFLGGVYRYMAEGSEYGVHRASTQSGPSEFDLDNGQIISALIGAYIREMEVDSRLLDLIVGVGKDDIYVLSTRELKEIGVINNGRKKSAWSVEVIEGGNYLKGTQETAFGKSKSIFMCNSGDNIFISVYSAGDKSEIIANENWSHSLFIDSQVIHLDKPLHIKGGGDYINSMFTLSDSVIHKLSNTRESIGHAMQINRDAPTFVGYTIDIDKDSISKFITYIRNCLRK